MSLLRNSGDFSNSSVDIERHCRNIDTGEGFTQIQSRVPLINKPLPLPSQSRPAVRAGRQRLDQRRQREELAQLAAHDPPHHQPHAVVREVSPDEKVPFQRRVQSSNRVGLRVMQVHRRDDEPGGASGRLVACHRDPAGVPGAQQLQRRAGGGQRHQLGPGLQTGPHV